MGTSPQPLLLPVRCPACGRPGRELSPCPWCGERAPLASRTRADVACVAAGLALLAASWIPGLAGTAAALLAGFLAGIFLAPRGAAAAEAAPCAALVAALLALALRAGAAPYPIPFAMILARAFPAIAAAAFALRVPAEAPNAPASGAPPRERALRRHAPDLVAAALLLPFAVRFPADVSPVSLAALALVLGVLLSRLSRPLVPLLASAACLSLLLPDPAAFALGLLLPGVLRGARSLAAKGGGMVDFPA